MPYTTTQLARQVLENGGLIDAREDVSAEDNELITRVYQAKYAELEVRNRHYSYWTRDTIPDAVFLILADLIWNEVRSSYEGGFSAAQKEAEEEAVLRRLNGLISAEATELPVKGVYF